MKALFAISRICRSGGAEKPTWAIPRSRLFGPRRADKHHYGEHATYGYFVLFLRGIRPHLENGIISTADVSKKFASGIYSCIRNTVTKHNPDLRMQLVALTSFAATSMTITGCFNDMYQQIIDITSLLEYRAAKEYSSEGFWLQGKEQVEMQEQEMLAQKNQIEKQFEEALASATASNSFQNFCSFLSHNPPNSVPFRLYPFAKWSFESLPYGDGNKDTVTFPIPDYEKPLRAFSLSFTSNNLSGNWGDYVNRQDNKGSIMRPSRQMFTDVYIGPTK